LSKISVEGGAVVPLDDAGIALGASWGPPETVAGLANGETALAFPQLLPGGKAILFSAYANPSQDAASIEVMTTNQGRGLTSSSRVLSTPQRTSISRPTASALWR
jgi:hypothetical protein